MQYTITIDDLMLGQQAAPEWNPQLWLVTFGASAAHVYSFKKGGAHIYDTHMAKLALEMQEKIAEAAEKAPRKARKSKEHERFAAENDGIKATPARRPEWSEFWIQLMYIYTHK